MKNNARKAYTVLEKEGLTLMINNWSANAHFEISVEEMPESFANLSDDASVYWADYYDWYDGSDDLNNLLQRHGLYFEWINAAVIGIYDSE